MISINILESFNPLNSCHHGPLTTSRIAKKLETIFTLETFFYFCWAGTGDERTSTMGVKDNTKRPSSIGTVKHSAPEVATQPSGCVRSMKACPCSVSAQWKSRVPLLLTPHYPTQYSNPVRQLNWVAPHVRASIHQKSSLARFFPLCIYYVFIESEFSLTFGLTAEATPWENNKQTITSSLSVQNLYRQ